MFFEDSSGSTYDAEFRYDNNFMFWRWGGGTKLYWTSSGVLYFGDYDSNQATDYATQDPNIRKVGSGTDIGDLRFRTNNIDRMHIDGPNGQIGIGTASPDALLHLSGVTNQNLLRIENQATSLSQNDALGGIEFENNDTTDDSPNVAASIFALAGPSGGSGALDFRTTPVGLNAASATSTMFLDHGGRVGIGTTTPSRTLHVVDSAGPTIKFERSASSDLEFTFGTANASIISAGEIQFRANGGTTNKFIINNSQIQSNAKFLVNTSSGIDVHTSDSGNILLSGNSSASGTPDQFFLKHNFSGVELGNSRGRTTVTTGDFQINTQFRLTSSGSGLTVIRHNGTNGYYENYTGNLHFFQHADGKNIIFHSDDGSGSTNEYYRVDGANLRNVFSKGVDITGTLTTTATFGNRSTNQGINFETPTTALQTARVDSDAFRFYFEEQEEVKKSLDLRRMVI